MVEQEVVVFKSLMKARYLRPAAVALFWLIRSVIICVVCLLGFLLFYFGLRFQPAHALDCGLIWFLFTLQVLPPSLPVSLSVSLAPPSLAPP